MLIEGGVEGIRGGEEGSSEEEDKREMWGRKEEEN